MLDRKSLVRKYNPVLTKADVTSPLTVGNGCFAFTADVTGLQTLWDAYETHSPLLTQADFGWHSAPDDEGRFFKPSDVEMTKYDFNGRTVEYAIEPQPGNEHVFDWLRKNQHRLNLMRVRLFRNGKAVSEAELSGIHQELDLFTGILTSRFTLQGAEYTVKTVAGDSDTLGFSVSSPAGLSEITVEIDFPYGSHEITASDFSKPEAHKTEVIGASVDGKTLRILHTLDRDAYVADFSADGSVSLTGAHTVSVKPDGGNMLSAAVTWAPGNERSAANIGKAAGFVLCENLPNPAKTFADVEKESVLRYEKYWMQGGIVDVSKSEDPRAEELERRIILSMYLTAVQSSGHTPPQETGLT